MKKTISVIITLLLITAMIAGTGYAEETTLPVHVEGSIFGGSSSDSIGLELRFDPEWITEGDSTVYNAELAAFSAIASADIYFRTKDLERGTQNRVLIDGSDPGQYDQTVLLSRLGFSDVRYVESFKAMAYETDPNDSVTLMLAYCNDRDRYDCFVVAVRGCFSSGEWNSVFDVGHDDGAYIAMTGMHPEWTDTDLMKGVGIAANRAMEFIGDYIAAHDDPARGNCILVTGHSRGGAVAQIIGARFEDDQSTKSCTYTFNASPVTDKKEAEGYGTVFNIFDSADFFADCLPFGNETFYRYGRTLSADIGRRTDILKAVSGIKGTDDYRHLKDGPAAGYRELFGRLFPDRASLYEKHTVTRWFADKASADAELERCRALAGAESGLGVEQFCSLSGVEKSEDGKYGFSIGCCRAALLQSVGRILAYGQSACDAVKQLFSEEEGICAIADLIMENAGDITAGHRILNSYALTGFLQGGDPGDK